MNAIFGPNTPRVLQFIIKLRKLTEAEIDQVTSTWSQVNPVDRALTWAQLQLATAAKEEYPVMAAASAAGRAAMGTARMRGRDDWAFWAAAWDAGAAITADDLAEGGYETLTFPLGTVMPALTRGRTVSRQAADAQRDTGRPVRGHRAVLVGGLDGEGDHAADRGYERGRQGSRAYLDGHAAGSDQDRAATDPVDPAQAAHHRR